MNLAVDIGNTRIKVGWFESSTLQKQRWLADIHEIPSLIRQETSLKAIILSSVAGIPVAGSPVASLPVADTSIASSTPTSELLKQWEVPTVVLDGHTPLPFFNTYHTPATLGTDRIAAVAGAQHLNNGQNSLTIDVGTCITYDVIDRAGHYQGGVISPGVRMRLQAMHTFTARLPLVEWKNEGWEADDSDENSSAGHRGPDIIERSTKEGLRSGAVRGAAAEISQMIRMYAHKFPDLRVILCGGDASSLLPYIYQDYPDTGASVSVVPELILIGLNSILEYNVNQKN